MSAGSKNLIYGLVFFVIAGVFLVGAITKLFVRGSSKQITAISNLETQRLLVNRLNRVAVSEKSYTHTLNMNPKLFFCHNACKRLDTECFSDRASCPPMPESKDPASFMSVETIELRDASNQQLSSKDGLFRINDDMKACGDSAGLAPDNSSCQWQLLVRAFASRDRMIHYHMTLKHLPQGKKKAAIQIPEKQWEVETEQPRVFAFKRFLARGRVETNRPLVYSFTTDGAAEVSALVRCESPHEKVTLLKIDAKGCARHQFGPTEFGSKGGRSSGVLHTLGENECSIIVSIPQNDAACVMEIDAKTGRFSGAKLEGSLGTARLENLLLTLYGVPKGQEILCRFKNGGLLDAPGPGLGDAEFNLCNCGKEACYGDDQSESRLKDGPPFKAQREARVKTQNEVWLEVRNATSDSAAASVEVRRP